MTDMAWRCLYYALACTAAAIVDRGKTEALKNWRLLSPQFLKKLK